jgi:hypothetical protein
MHYQKENETMKRSLIAVLALAALLSGCTSLANFLTSAPQIKLAAYIIADIQIQNNYGDDTAGALKASTDAHAAIDAAYAALAANKLDPALVQLAQSKLTDELKKIKGLPAVDAPLISQAVVSLIQSKIGGIVPTPAP